jgi:hypothetical protein
MGAESVTFKDKMEGDQFGNCIVAHMKDGQEITYHAKTHRGGLRASQSQSA